MNIPWFKRIGWFFVPCSVPGGAITLIALAFCAQVFWAVDRRSHSISDTLYGIFPYLTGAFLLFDWIAGRTSNNSNHEK